MLRFFRLIRRKLIEEDNARKYFWYAIGEVFLVVIGILIALQINNWNEERKGRELEQVYIQNLIEDLENQVIELNVQKDNETMVKAALIRTSDKIVNGFTKDNIQEYNKDVQAMTVTRTLNLYDATFEDLKSTGNLNLIKNESLKQDILDHFQLSNRYVYVIRKGAESYHHFIFEDLISRELVNFDITGMSNIIGLDSELFNTISKEVYPEQVNEEFNNRLLLRFKEVDNRQAIKNSVNNRKWTNHVALLFLQEMEDRTNVLIGKLKEELN